MKYIGMIKDKRIGFAPLTQAKMNMQIKDPKNDGRRVVIEIITPESRNQRGFYHGGVIGLWAWLDGNDNKDSSVMETYHNYAKEEFNTEEVIKINGKVKKVGGSTKGKLNDIIEKVIEYLEENYAINRDECLNPEHYKYFIDAIYSDGQFDTYQDYLVSLGRLKRPQ